MMQTHLPNEFMDAQQKKFCELWTYVASTDCVFKMIGLITSQNSLCSQTSSIRPKRKIT